jgi:hypothetical protein
MPVLGVIQVNWYEILAPGNRIAENSDLIDRVSQLLPNLHTDKEFCPPESTVVLNVYKPLQKNNVFSLIARILRWNKFEVPSLYFQDLELPELLNLLGDNFELIIE